MDLHRLFMMIVALYAAHTVAGVHLFYAGINVIAKFYRYDKM